MTLCRDCEYSRPWFTGEGEDWSGTVYCAVPVPPPNIVDGTNKYQRCSIRRDPYGTCGPNAKDFAPRELGRNAVVVRVEKRSWWRS